MMKIGVQVPEVERFVPWTEYRDLAIAAEGGGLDSLWVGDHLLYDLPNGSTRGPWECWTLLAGLAAVTETIGLSPLVASTGFHSPAMLAKKAATVDEISGGRLTVSLGSGWNEREYSAFGFAYDKRASRFEEAFTIIRTLLRQGSIDFAGEYYQVRDCVLDPPARPDIPILVGPSGPRMLAMTLPFVDAWNIWFDDYDNDPSRLPG
ncbi:MAG: LLM class flavin-dependent oxidoreductase, partial [Acidimicrobiales bacterium]